MWVGWVHHSWRFGHVEAVREVGPKMPECGSKTSTLPVVWATFGFFFGAIQMISCHDWWPWMKPGYITMTCKQSNNQWSGGIEAYPTPKNSKCKIHCKSSRLNFLGSRPSSTLIIFQRAELSTWSITYLCWCNWRTFWRKNATGSSPRRSCSRTTLRSLLPRRPGCMYNLLNFFLVACKS